MGEKSKKSGEIGEKIASELLKLLGWKNSMHNISIDCNTPSHLNEAQNQRTSHGEDQIFIYHNPFHDDRTEVVHVSIKNTLGKAPAESTLKTKFKSHFKELQETIECAKYSPELKAISTAFTSKNEKSHSGLLIWLHNDEQALEIDLKPILSSTRLESDAKFPVYLIDNSRASFLLKAIEDVNIKFREYEIQFFYPPIGTSVFVDEARSGNTLPMELIASDIVPFIIKKDNAIELIIYADQEFSIDAYKKLISYALQFSNGLVANIEIGMPDFNPTKHENDAKIARMHFSSRKENIIPFSFNRSILSLLDKEV